MSLRKAKAILLGSLLLIGGEQVVYAENIQAKEQIGYERYYEIIEEDNYIGKFTITYYCGCRECNGKWTGYPAKNGEPLKEGYTIAVDPNVIPLNSWVYIEGIGDFKACDTGSAIKGNRIDVFINNHKKCMELGKKKDIGVWKIEK